MSTNYQTGPGHPLAGLMDKQGMLPADVFCLRCAKPLDADGGHPAERYLGTYNGLCYRCTSEGPYVAAVAVLDGCRRVSWAPAEPSYRRSRENFYGYEGCENCEGMGVAGYRSTGGYWCGGRSREYCKPCQGRYSGHPLRRSASAWREQVMRSCEAVYERAIDQAAGVPARCTRKRRAELREAFIKPREEGRSPECEALRLIYYAGYERLQALVRSHFDALHVNEWTSWGRTEDEFFRLYCQWRGYDYDQVMANGGRLPAAPASEEETQAGRDKLLVREEKDPVAS